MARPIRHFIGNQMHHMLNRGNGRAGLFEKPADYQAFQTILQESVRRFSMRPCCYCLMPNHWHPILWPRHERGEDASAFLQWMTMTHAQRWHAYRGTAGTGHLYQGRFKSFPVQSDGHMLKVFRYVEQNALRARLVETAQDWPYSSLWQHDLDVPHRFAPQGRDGSDVQRRVLWRHRLVGALQSTVPWPIPIMFLGPINRWREIRRFVAKCQKKQLGANELFVNLNY